MIQDHTAYHQLELLIARDPADPRRVMPQINRRHGRILDVGCGAGQTLIASELPAGALAIGVDVDHAALALGKQLSSAIPFACAKGEALPFESATFDLVICRIALPYMHFSTAISEMARVLRPGGDVWLVLHPFRLALKELRTSLARGQVKSVLYRLWVGMNGLTLHASGKQWSWPSNPKRYESWQTNRSVKRALEAAGFDQILINRETHFVVSATKKRDIDPKETRRR